MQAQILTVGSLNMDVVVRVPRHPLPGETILGGPYQTFPGGKGGNQAVAVARAGGRSQLHALVGEDGFGRELLQALSDAGVDTAAVAAIAGPSGIALIVVDDRGENSIVVSPGANAQLLPERLNLSAIARADLLMLQLEIPLETVATAIAAAQHDAPVLLNPAPAQPLADEVLQQVTYLVANESEAALLTGRRTDEISDREAALAAARELRDRGAKTAIVTLGERGAVWSDRGGEGQVSAYAVEAVDTTAAGDGFCGALAVGLAEGMGVERAVRFANAAGAIAVTGMGAQGSLGDREAIEGLLQRSNMLEF
ncbi:ribokinase [Synechococcus sp. PCC 7336]|uniref:ribokinase n=1 Tax=Synechococcus sp. PCC 7336 TaxID=195250 RepID=UPI0003483146|nr:ribokinase [Synechococcus sp. PCC 7336]